MMKIYATINDELKFVLHPKGSERHKGEAGNWKTLEGVTVAKDVDVFNPHDFATKSDAIKLLWPGATVRFMNETKA